MNNPFILFVYKFLQPNSNITQQISPTKIRLIVAKLLKWCYNTYTVLGGELVVPYIRNQLYAERNYYPRCHCIVINFIVLKC